MVAFGQTTCLWAAVFVLSAVLIQDRLATTSCDLPQSKPLPTPSPSQIVLPKLTSARFPPGFDPVWRQRWLADISRGIIDPICSPLTPIMEDQNLFWHVVHEHFLALEFLRLFCYQRHAHIEIFTVSPLIVGALYAVADVHLNPSAPDDEFYAPLYHPRQGRLSKYLIVHPGNSLCKILSARRDLIRQPFVLVGPDNPSPNFDHFSNYGVLSRGVDFHCADDPDIMVRSCMLRHYFAQHCPSMTLEKVIEFLDDERLIGWFVQQDHILFRRKRGEELAPHPKVISVPVGMWFKQAPLHAIVSNITHQLIGNSRRRFIAVRASRSLERPVIYNQVKTAVPGHDDLLTPNDQHESPLSYASSVLQMKFTPSPPGWGSDCYRHWESLALGCIPIPKHGSLDATLASVPVIIVEDYSVLSKSFLEEFWAHTRAMVVESYLKTTPENMRESVLFALTNQFWQEEVIAVANGLGNFGQRREKRSVLIRGFVEGNTFQDRGGDVHPIDCTCKCALTERPKCNF